MLKKEKGLLRIKNFVKSNKIIFLFLSLYFIIFLFGDYKFSYRLKEYFENDSSSINFDILTKENSIIFKNENIRYIFKENSDTFYLVDDENKTVTTLSFEFFDFFSSYLDKNILKNKKMNFVKDTVLTGIPVKYFSMDIDSLKRIKMFVTKENFELSKMIKRYNNILKSYLNVDFEIIFDSIYGGIPVLFELINGKDVDVDMQLLSFQKDNFEREFVIPQNYKINR
ncbi:MAG: hypothetical protein ABIN35_01740 [candidate division WOR-3 bacterium]